MGHRLLGRCSLRLCVYCRLRYYRLRAGFGGCRFNCRRLGSGSAGLFDCGCFGCGYFSFSGCLEPACLFLDKLVFLGLYGFAGFDLASDTGIGHSCHIQLDRAYRIVVTRDDVINTIRVAIGIDDTDHGNTQLVGFGDGDTLVIHVDNKQRVGQAPPYS